MMKKILQLDSENYDLWITYSWSTNNHGVCGHTFEVLDYYFFLKKFFRVGILIAEDLDWNTFQKVANDKYEITADELTTLQKDTVFFNRPSIVRGNNILFTDGGVKSLESVTLFFKNIFHFACGQMEIKNYSKENATVLLDQRIYGQYPGHIHYVKKIFFEKYKKYTEFKQNTLLVYATKNCRNLDTDQFEEIMAKYPHDVLCLTNKENRPTYSHPRLKVQTLPIDGLFNEFSSYLYTPVPRKFDCSPRLIAECKFYGRDVIYHNIDYLNEDLGLYYRIQDIENDFSKLWLKDGDEIVNIIKGKI